MARFDRSIATAIRLIAKNGQVVTWRSVENGPPVVSNEPWNPDVPTNVDHVATICFLPVSRYLYETFSFINKTEVPKGNLLGLMGNVPFDPNLKDIVIRDGRELRIADINVISPNGQKVLYTVVFQQ